MTPRQNPIHGHPRRRSDNLAKWVGLLALAGLLAIATLPPKSGHHADDVDATAIASGAASWHG